jgi:hypothetical protein
VKRISWQVIFGIALLTVSSLIYFEQISLFHAPRDTFFYLFQDLAFVPINVLLVTLIVDRVLRMRERAALMKKLNMVIGAFFSEAGTRLLRYFVAFDEEAGNVGKRLAVNAGWDPKAFEQAMKELKQHPVRIDHRRGDLAGLKDFLVARRGFLLGLLENQNLLEHETFTELLWAVFHLMEELASRSEVRSLGAADGEHIAGDIRRAYLILIVEWLAYMQHLKTDYPYLFSLAVRTNPFDPAAKVEVQ